MSKQFKYIDIHSHVNFSVYDADRQQVILRAQDVGVAMINVGTQIDTSKKALELAQTHEGLYAAIGLHPVHTSKSHHDVQELGEGGKEFTSRGEVVDIEAYRMLAKHPKCVAIGECGLDYYSSLATLGTSGLEEQAVDKQCTAFEAMIDLANEVNKPLMLHIRSGSGRSAYKDAYEIIKAKAKVRGNLHFYAGSIEEAKPFLDLGFTFSFTGVITFARNYDEVVKYLPLASIMSETDCPYVTPAPYRGKKNEPAYVVEVVKAIAKIKGEGEEKVAGQIMVNAKEFFGDITW